jgi:hypothetical protein
LNRFGDAHARLTTDASDKIQKASPRGLIPRVVEVFYIEDPGSYLRVAVPDVIVCWTPGGTKSGERCGIAPMHSSKARDCARSRGASR